MRDPQISLGSIPTLPQRSMGLRSVSSIHIALLEADFVLTPVVWGDGGNRDKRVFSTFFMVSSSRALVGSVKH
jgi:hypothetical protein